MYSALQEILFWHNEPFCFKLQSHGFDLEAEIFLMYYHDLLDRDVGSQVENGTYCGLLQRNSLDQKQNEGLGLIYSFIMSNE